MQIPNLSILWNLLIKPLLIMVPGWGHECVSHTGLVIDWIIHSQTCLSKQLPYTGPVISSPVCATVNLIVYFSMFVPAVVLGPFLNNFSHLTLNTFLPSMDSLCLHFITMTNCSQSNDFASSITSVSGLGWALVITFLFSFCHCPS